MSIVKGVLLASLIALAPACSGHQDAEEEVAADPKDAAKDAAEPAADAPAPAPPPAEEPAAETAEAPPPPPPPPPAAPAEPEGFNGPKTTRYVRVVAIKVHALPNKESPVLGWVKKGDSVDVVVNGDWAKLGPGRYISNKFLVDQPVSTQAPAKKSKAGR